VSAPSGGLANDPEGADLGQDGLHHVEDRLGERHVDDLSLPGSIAVQEREEDADHAVQPAQRVAQREVRANGRLTGRAGDVTQPRHRLAHRCEASALSVGTRLAEPRDARDDQRRLALEQRLGAEAPALERAGPEVLHHDVTVEREAPRERLPRLGVEIERDAPLVPRQAPPPHAGVPIHAAPSADGIARERLELHDLGPEVSEHRARERARDELPELEHLHPVERAWPRGLVGRRRRLHGGER
jgi:hypothetical protein